MRGDEDELDRLLEEIRAGELSFGPSDAVSDEGPAADDAELSSLTAPEGFVPVGFTMGYLNWLDRSGFWVRDAWDEASQEWTIHGRLRLTQDQRRILGEALSVDDRGRLRYTDVLLSMIKKSGKTTIAASIGAWVGECGPAGSEIYVLANDVEQAEGRVMRDIKYHVQHAVPKADVLTYKINYPNGTTITALAQHYKSAAGSRHVLTLWDELWGYTSENSRRMWSEMTPIPTAPNSLRVITTYAGFEDESDLLWEQYLRGVGTDEHAQGRGVPIEGMEDLPAWSNKKLFCYWDHDPRMPWQTPEYYADQLEQLRPADYLRLHENRWVTSTETFLPIEWYQLAQKAYERSADLWREHPYRNFPVWVGVDVAPKHDSSAVVGVTFDPARGKAVRLFGRIWTPVEGELFDLEDTVEKYILDQARRFNVVSVHYDPAQFHRSMVTLYKLGLKMEEFTQSEGNMIEASQNFYDLLRTKALEDYPDPEMESHIRAAVAKMTPRGFRIVKDPRGTRARRKPVDGAVAYAIAAYKAVQQGGRADTSKPIRIEVPFADGSGMQSKPADALDEERLPFPLRS